MDIYTGNKLTEQEYKLFADLIYNYSGINLGDNKKELVKARLQKRLRHYQFSSYKEYYDYVVNDATKKEILELINAISTNVTHFFRENQHFIFMTKTALPEIVERKKLEKTNAIKIWSCASATGEELYSIAIILLEFFKDRNVWEHLS